MLIIQDLADGEVFFLPTKTIVFYIDIKQKKKLCRIEM